jgi:hypothetical protein
MSVSTITVATADEARVVGALRAISHLQPNPLLPLPLPGEPGATNGLSIGVYIAALLKQLTVEHEARDGGSINGPPPTITNA